MSLSCSVSTSLRVSEGSGLRARFLCCCFLLCAGPAQRRVQGSLLMNRYLVMKDLMLIFKVLTLVWGPPLLPRYPHSRPKDIFALSLASPQLCSCGCPAKTPLSPTPAPFSSGHHTNTPSSMKLSPMPSDNPSCHPGPHQPCPSFWPSPAPMLCLLKG